MSVLHTDKMGQKLQLTRAHLISRAVRGRDETDTMGCVGIARGN